MEFCETNKLKDAIRYKIYKRVSTSQKGVFKSLFSSPIPMVILKTEDVKTKEMDKQFFAMYMLDDKTFHLQNI